MPRRFMFKDKGACSSKASTNRKIFSLSNHQYIYIYIYIQRERERVRERERERVRERERERDKHHTYTRIQYLVQVAIEIFTSFLPGKYEILVDGHTNIVFSLDGYQNIYVGIALFSPGNTKYLSMATIGMAIVMKRFPCLIIRVKIKTRCVYIHIKIVFHRIHYLLKCLGKIGILMFKMLTPINLIRLSINNV